MADRHLDQVSFSPQQQQPTNTLVLANHEHTTEQPHNMPDQHRLDQLSTSPEEMQVRNTPLTAHYEAPWSSSINPDARFHKLCKCMMDAFVERDYDTAQCLAHVLLVIGDVLFRVYAHLVLAYGVRHGLDHAHRAVEEAEHAIYTLQDEDGQVAYLLALAKRTVLIIEEQDTTMKDYHYLSDIEEEDEEKVEETGRSQEMDEAPVEAVTEIKGKENDIPKTPTVVDEKFDLATWDFGSLKDSKRSAPEQS